VTGAAQHPRLPEHREPVVTAVDQVDGHVITVPQFEHDGCRFRASQLSRRQ
jgi:hypothetical protein